MAPAATTTTTNFMSLFFHSLANPNVSSLSLLPVYFKPHIHHHNSKLVLSTNHHHHCLFLPSPSCRLLSFTTNCEPTEGNNYYTDFESTAQEEEEKNGGEEEREAEEYTVEIKKRPGATSRTAGDPGRLFIGNIPYSMTSRELAEIFSQAGNVQTAEVIYDRVTDRSRGFAFVHMATVEEASKAIEMFDGSQLGGRTMKVNFPEVPRGGERKLMKKAVVNASRGFIDTPCKIYAGNLGWNLSSDRLREAFAAQPGLLGARIIFEADTGRSRGFGFVTFESEEEMQAAMEAMDGVMVEGRPLRLSRASKTIPTATTSPQPERSTSQSIAAEREESNWQTSSTY